ncbi:MAG: phosphatase PAP2 family protein [Actinomycetes bacterium]
MTMCELTAGRAPQRSRSPRDDRGSRSSARMRPAAKVELALLALLYLGYTAARLVGHADLPTATAHAYRLLHIEDALHLDVERTANRLLDASPLVALIGSYWYSVLHYVVTPAVLFWAYRRHPFDYRRVRNALVIGSAIGLVGFTVLPMAPPRMLPGYVDTLATTAQHGWWGGDASAPKGLGALTNQLAAMPSLHVGWALWCAWVVASLTTRRWLRIAAFAYPLGTTIVVIGTANHYVLDAVAGMAVMLIGMRLARRTPVVPRIPTPRIPTQRRPPQSAASLPSTLPASLPSTLPASLPSSLPGPREPRPAPFPSPSEQVVDRVAQQQSYVAEHVPAVLDHVAP